MIVLTAVMEALPGKEQEMENALRAMIPAVRSEEGTLTYVLHRAQGNPGKFFFYEAYRDEAALAHHSGTPHLAELFGKLVSLTAGEPVIDMYEVLASKD
jgi:quinol monooxygenase YgiN